MAIGWSVIGDPDCAPVRRGFMCVDAFDCGALMLANAGLVCRGDMFISGVVVSGEVWFDRFIGLQSEALRICGEPIVDSRLMPPCCSILLAQLFLWSGLLTNLSSLLRRLGLAVLSSFIRLASVMRVRQMSPGYQKVEDLLLGSCLALKSSR
jgi:hypothetical protein